MQQQLDGARAAAHWLPRLASPACRHGQVVQLCTPTPPPRRLPDPPYLLRCLPAAAARCAGLGHLDPSFSKLADGMVAWIEVWRGRGGMPGSRGRRCAERRPSLAGRLECLRLQLRTALVLLGGV